MYRVHNMEIPEPQILKIKQKYCKLVPKIKSTLKSGHCLLILCSSCTFTVLSLLTFSRECLEWLLFISCYGKLGDFGAGFGLVQAGTELFFFSVAVSRDTMEYSETKLRRVNDSFVMGIISEAISKRNSRKPKRWFSDVEFCMATELKTPVYLMKKVMRCF